MKAMGTEYMKPGLLCLLIGALLLSQAAGALMNPAAVYCGAMNYTYTTGTTDAGAVGYCILDDGQSVDAWKFLKGMEGQEYSYCAINGYTMKTVSDRETCAGIYSDSCAVCVMPDGTEVEVSGLMALPLKEPDLVIGAVTGQGTATPASAGQATATGEAALPVVMPLFALGAAALVMFRQRDR